MDAWRTSCPRMSICEDAQTDGLAQIQNQAIALTPQGEDRLGHRYQLNSPIVKATLCRSCDRSYYRLTSARGESMMTLLVAFVIGVPILLLFVLAGRRFVHAPTLSGGFLVLGAASLVVMVLTHVAEGLHLFSFMGWGQRHSPGHYLDLGSVYLGIAFLVAACLCPLLRTRSE